MSPSRPATRNTSPDEPAPSIASASNTERSAADSPATISSQRNWRVAPGGADRTSRTNEGHPANPTHLGIGERERVPTDFDHLPGRPPPSERDRHRTTAGEQEVSMGWHPRRQLLHEAFAGRPRRKLMEVVHDDADIEGGDGVQRAEHALYGTATTLADAER